MPRKGAYVLIGALVVVGAIVAIIVAVSLSSDGEDASANGGLDGPEIDSGDIIDGEALAPMPTSDPDSGKFIGSDH